MGKTSLQQEIGKRQPFEHAELEAALNIARTSSVLEGDFVRLFKQHGLSHAAYNTLRILRGHLCRDGDTTKDAKNLKAGCEQGARPLGGVPSQTIGEQLITRVPDVTRLVDRLVEAGLAMRTGIEGDRRVVLVCITKAGLDLLAQLDKPILELHQKQLGHMSRERLELLSELLVEARSRCKERGK